MTNPNHKDVDVQALQNQIASLTKPEAGISEKKLDAIMAIADILLAKEARLAEKEAALESALKERDKRRRQESDNYMLSRMATQRDCSHLKGGKHRQRGQQRDPAVSLHQFIDGGKVIKCLLCGAKWLPGDTREYLVRNGGKLKNWTNKGWADAMELVADSSNKFSSSEVVTGKPSSVDRSVLDDESGKSVPNVQI